MRPAVLLLLLASSAAIADTTTRYSISFQGRVSGAQTTTVANDGTLRVVFTYRDNGRGPDINETIRVAPDGSLREFRATGKSTFGAPISETFQRKGAAATWRSVSDRGETQSAGAAVYIPVDSSFEIPALTARALLKEPTHRLPGLPGGQLAIEKLTDVSLQRGGESRTVSLYSITGVDFEPFFLWLSAPDQKFFGYIYSGYFRVLEGGWEAEGDRLAQAQQGAEQAMQRELKHRLGHRLPMPILIRNVNVFDSGSGKLLGARDVYVDQGQIAAIYETGSVARDAQTVIDGAGRTLLPGLFDMHAHVGRLGQHVADRRRRHHGPRHGQRQCASSRSSWRTSTQERCSGRESCRRDSSRARASSPRRAASSSRAWSRRATPSTGMHSAATGKSRSTTLSNRNGSRAQRSMRMSGACA